MADVDEDFYVAGIGASAGGLEALEEFFAAADISTPIAYVVIQHVSPDFKSLMDQLLARKTSIPIHIIEDAVDVRPHNIYLLPPKKEAIISQGKLLLTDRPTEHLNFPIDHFLRSLAQDMGTRSIAVILSGTGTDGKRGVVDVSSSGGLVITQRDPRFDGMPVAARDTGVVDAQLSCEMIPSALGHHIDESLLKNRPVLGQHLGVSEPIARILTQLNSHYGIDFSEYRASTITRRLKRRVSLCGVEDLEHYAELVGEDHHELDRLYGDLLIGVTHFFRDEDVFDKLADQVIPAIAARGRDEIRVWVAGCATGEEAYTVSMLLHEHFESRGAAPSIRVFATDVHEKSLATASRGIYSEEQVASVGSERLNRFFVRRNGHYQIAPHLRKSVVFSPHNVVRDAPFTKLDLITCRNLLIYLTPEAQRKVLSLFHFGLRREAFLVLGSSESIGDLEDVYHTYDDRSRIFTKHRDMSLPANNHLPGRENKQSPTNIELPILARSGVSDGRSLVRAYDQLLNEFMPPSLLVDTHRQIIHVFPGADRYLQFASGRPRNDILTMLHPDLITAVSTSMRRSEKLRKTVVVRSIPFHSDGQSESLTITVSQVGTGEETPKLLIQLQSENVTSALPVETEEISFAAGSLEFQEIQRELEYTKDSLQSTIEELQSTNEELQSANEELTAANEELQSTNEELHSVNEELYMVNSEHQRKITELVELTNDMDNLLNSIDVHTLFLDRDMGIRRFTPGIGDIFNLVPQDIGRRFDNFVYRIGRPQLSDDIQAVIEEGVGSDFEVCEQLAPDQPKTWFFLRIRPYVAPEIEGVVLTMVDITKLKEAQVRLLQLSQIVEHSDDAIYRVDVEGIIRTWNQGAVKLFGFQVDEAIGRHDSILVPDGLVSESRASMQRILQGQEVDRIESIRKTKEEDLFDVALTVSPIRDHNGAIEGASVIARDMTRQRRAVEQRDLFLATLSHELRNPFAAILNASSLLKEEQLDAETEVEARELIGAQLEHISLLLDDLLDVARFMNGKLTVRPEVIDVTRQASTVLDCVQHRFDSTDQNIQLQVEDRPIYVLADPSRLQQAQVNLLVNASKYSGKGCSIWYSIGQDGDEAVITVRDEGDGISSTLLPTIFEPFVQSGQSEARTQGGMGLGLPLVKAITEAHNGKVEAHSAGPGHGAEFTIRIPVTDQRPTTKEKKPDGEFTTDARVLLLEDNAGIRRMLARTLQLKGFEVVTAENAQRGLDAVSKGGLDVAVVDIGLPDMNGYEFAQRVRADRANRNLRLIAVTGYGREEDRALASEAGFDLHLIKPVEPQNLMRKISQLAKPQPSTEGSISNETN
ncbi:MAG: CheR family methyltransferase [Planctomycetota bacterium]